jgi:citrate lyase subunit beta/citryl-CoA lyase
VDGPSDVCALTRQLDEHELDLTVLALLETAGGILEAEAIADVDGTDAILVGAEDLAADIGATRTEERMEVLYARQRVVLAASRADVHAIDTLFTDFEDTDGLSTDAQTSKEWGFDGKIAIHPRQVPIINDAFTPDEQSIEWARRVLSARDEADKAEQGVFEVDGEMIDAPLIAQAENVIKRAGSDSVRDRR